VHVLLLGRSIGEPQFRAYSPKASAAWLLSSCSGPEKNVRILRRWRIWIAYAATESERRRSQSAGAEGTHHLILIFPKSHDCADNVNRVREQDPNESHFAK
jgi:hypothetical protein